MNTNDLKRRDSKGRILYLNETQLSDGRYCFRYYMNNKRKTVYSWKLQSSDKIPYGKRKDISLREKEKIIQRQQFLYGNFYNAKFTVLDLVERYVAQKQGVRDSTKNGYLFVIGLLKKDSFGSQKISLVRTSDAKLWLISLQQHGRKYSSIQSIRGVLRPAFQMAVDDDFLLKNPFDFELRNIIENDTQIRIPLTAEERDLFLKFVKNDSCYSKYYNAFFILFHTGMRISEFCGLTLSDVDMTKRIIHINHQLHRCSDMTYEIIPTKTSCGRRDLPMTPEVYTEFQNIITRRKHYKEEPSVDGCTGFLFLDKNLKPKISSHWGAVLRNAAQKYNRTHDTLLPKITPHICRHTYCTLMARSGINPKTLQYLMGHAELSTTMDVYTHFSFGDAQKELNKLFPFSQGESR